MGLVVHCLVELLQLLALYPAVAVAVLGGTEELVEVVKEISHRSR
jgi:hypothetical protein